MIFFDTLILYVREFIAIIGVLVIACGALKSVYQFYLLFTGHDITTNYIRLEFGNSIILGLEFMVGADILESLLQPNYYNLGLLGILVVIRIILSYFLNLELEALTPKQKQDIN